MYMYIFHRRINIVCPRQQSYTYDEKRFYKIKNINGTKQKTPLFINGIISLQRFKRRHDLNRKSNFLIQITFVS